MCKRTRLVPSPTFLLSPGYTGPQSAPHKTYNTHLFGFVLAIKIVPLEEPDLALRPHRPHNPQTVLLPVFILSV